MGNEKLITPDNCESKTLRTGRDKEFVVQVVGMDVWAKENPKQFDELHKALFKRKK